MLPQSVSVDEQAAQAQKELPIASVMLRPVFAEAVGLVACSVVDWRQPVALSVLPEAPRALRAASWVEHL